MQNFHGDSGETSRRLILGELLAGRRNVSELIAATRLKQPNISNHLGRMRLRGVVRSTKIGRQVFYEIASDATVALVRSMLLAESPAVPVDFSLLVREYAKAGVAGDDAACEEIMDRVYRAQVPLIDIYEDLISPAMAMVGAWYKVQAIDEAQEHMASAITERILARAAQVAGPAKRTSFLCVLGCAPGSWHVIGLRMIADYLKLEGWKTLYLGANVPIHSFLNTVATSHPSMALVSCGADESSSSTGDLVRALREERGPVLKIGVGGRVAPGHADALKAAGADFIAHDLRSFAATTLPEIERSLRSRGPV